MVSAEALVFLGAASDSSLSFVWRSAFFVLVLIAGIGLASDQWDFSDFPIHFSAQLLLKFWHQSHRFFFFFSRELTSYQYIQINNQLQFCIYGTNSGFFFIILFYFILFCNIDKHSNKLKSQNLP